MTKNKNILLSSMNDALDCDSIIKLMPFPKFINNDKKLLSMFDSNKFYKKIIK